MKKKLRAPIKKTIRIKVNINLIARGLGIRSERLTLLWRRATTEVVAEFRKIHGEHSIHFSLLVPL
ncbi:hypothetical protein Patl1_14035 [Pistacia atlantica]|uniref:Uncharacterized protein n=1 Tax=Pistacia atlantica TaxID=434234 RepID=A0ACC1AYR1_9ROSI|nr:hypothetical protein Patl1_14035 [Pistacia atlantica]